MADRLRDRMGEAKPRAREREQKLAREQLLEESATLGKGPYRLTNAEIERDRVRFDTARDLVAQGKVEAARRIFWWPRGENPPKWHWSRTELPACSCGRKAPSGLIGLCVYCSGATRETPSVIPVR